MIIYYLIDIFERNDEYVYFQKDKQNGSSRMNIEKRKSHGY